MKVSKDDGLWKAFSIYEERTILKAAGWWWHPGPGKCDRGGCKACKAGVGAQWWTPDLVTAARLSSYAEGDVRAELDGVKTAQVASKAVDADIDAPRPAGLEYLPFQRAGIAYAMERPGVLIADEMGLGKTIQALGVINADPTIKRVLAVVPATLRLNWEREARKWLVRPMRIRVIEGRDIPDEEDEFVVCNYEKLVGVRGDRLFNWIMAREWDLLIVDEAHYMKTPAAQRTKLILGKKARKKGEQDESGIVLKCRRRLFLTGTPILNKPVEIFGLLNTLAPQTFPEFFPFAKRYCLPGSAPILMADLTEKPISRIRVGDKVIGWARSGHKKYRGTEDRAQRRLFEATVLDVLSRKAPVQEVTLRDGTKLFCTPDHLWLNGYGKKGQVNKEFYPARTGRYGGQGRGCASKIVRIFRAPSQARLSSSFKRGYLIGAIRGDGYCSKLIHEKHDPFRARVSRGIRKHSVGFGAKDTELVDRVACFLDHFKIPYTRGDVRKDGITALYMTTAKAYAFASSPPKNNNDWWAGFLGGIYDSEGSGQVIAQDRYANPQTYAMIKSCLKRFGFSFRAAEKVIRFRGGRASMLRLWSIASPVLTRKLRNYVFNGGGKFMANDEYVSKIKPLGVKRVYTLRTSTGNYVAYGCGSKNCDAHQNRWGWDFDGATNLPELQEKMRSTCMIRRLKKDVLKELPPKRRQVIVLPTNGAQHAVDAENEAFEGIEEELFEAQAQADLAHAAGDEETYEAAVKRLRKVMGIALSQMSKVRHDTAVAKVPAVIEHLDGLLADGLDKVICFAHHHDVVHALRDHYGDSCVVITGETAQEDRMGIVDRFQTDPAVKVFLGGITAAGVGITLTAASTVVFAELDWVPGNVTQAEDRAHRIGQVESVLVQHLVLDKSLDARMAQRIVEKQEVMDKALDLSFERDLPALGEARPPKYPPATDEQKAAALHGLRILAGVCDGAVERDNVGYNGLDSRIGKSLAARSTLTDGQFWLARRLLLKYHGQIGEEILRTMGYEMKEKDDA